jgi:hypothetical protein
MNKKFCGLARSGNHAIIFWFLHNISDTFSEIAFQAYADSAQSVCFLNNYNNLTKKHDLIDLTKYQTIIYSYEDMVDDLEIDILILRDFLNLMSSRFKAYGLYVGPVLPQHGGIEYSRLDPTIILAWEQKYLNRFIRFTQIWKNHAKQYHKHILYNRWVLDKTYRDFISIEKLNIENKKDNTEYISIIGGGSSFNNLQPITDKDTYNKRFKLSQLPKQFLKYMLSDKELLDLNKDIFNIDIKLELNNVLYNQ